MLFTRDGRMERAAVIATVVFNKKSVDGRILMIEVTYAWPLLTERRVVAIGSLQEVVPDSKCLAKHSSSRTDRLERDGVPGVSVKLR